jgi:arsenate reductase
MVEGVLFVCYGNACRSIMAEALARHHFDSSLRVASAGIAALGHIPLTTLAVLREVGVSCDGLYSKGLDQLDDGHFNIIVNLTNTPIRRFIPHGIQGKLIDSSVPDPYGSDLDTYRRTREAVSQLIFEELPKWLNGPWT